MAKQSDSRDRLQIFLCRHGETEWSLNGRHTSFTDIPLTPAGEQQARQLGEKLKRFSFSRVIVSPRLRAQQTCRLAGLMHPHIDPDAAEWNYGAYEGQTTEQIWKQHPGWNVFENGTLDGESPTDVAARADRLLKSLLSLSGNVIIFSHGHFSRILAVRWLGLSPSAGKYFTLSVASMSILSHERDQRIIKLWNETAQL